MHVLSLSMQYAYTVFRIKVAFNMAARADSHMHAGTRKHTQRPFEPQTEIAHDECQNLAPTRIPCESDWSSSVRSLVPYQVPPGVARAAASLQHLQQIHSCTNKPPAGIRPSGRGAARGTFERHREGTRLS